MNTTDLSLDQQTIPVFARWFGSWRISVQRRPWTPPQLARNYDRAAPGWNRTLDRLGFPAAYESMLRQIVGTELPERTIAPFRVLDCGTGTGALSGALLRALPRPEDGQLKLDGIDISSRMLDCARRNLEPTGAEIRLRRGDACRLPYGDGAFDMVMTAHMLEHLPDPVTALREMVRVLKPGGMLVACLTRRSVLGMYIHLQWRTHPVTPGQANTWFDRSGLTGVYEVSFGAHPICRWLSRTVIARKPLQLPASASENPTGRETHSGDVL